MREIKFRAWDEGNKVMHYEFEFIRSGDDSGEGCDWIIFKSDKQKLEDSEVFDNPYFNLQLKLMQYTGLLDKNKKTIYEGDIMQVGGHYESDTWYDEEKIIIEFEDGGFNIDSVSIINYGIEKIGNIYENKELLDADTTTVH